MTAITIIITIAKWIGIMVTLAGISLYTWYISSFDYKVILRKRSKGRSLIITGKGRVRRDDEGTFHLTGSKLFKGINVTAPPDDSVEITTKGKKVVQGWILENGQIKWGKEKNPDSITLLEPVTQNQRAMLARQIVKAKEREGFNWMGHVPMIAGLVFILALFTLAIVYWEDITAPTTKALNQASVVIEKTDKLLGKVQEMDNGMQTVGQKPTTVTTTTLKNFAGAAS